MISRQHVKFSTLRYMYNLLYAYHMTKSKVKDRSNFFLVFVALIYNMGIGQIRKEQSSVKGKQFKQLYKFSQG